MQVKVRFPLNTGGRNWKAIREAVLLDSFNNGFEEKVVSAAERAKTVDQDIFVARTYGPAGRFSVWLVDRGNGDRMQRRKALKAALARFSI